MRTCCPPLACPHRIPAVVQGDGWGREHHGAMKGGKFSERYRKVAAGNERHDYSVGTHQLVRVSYTATRNRQHHFVFVSHTYICVSGRKEERTVLIVEHGVDDGGHVALRRSVVLAEHERFC